MKNLLSEVLLVLKIAERLQLINRGDRLARPQRRNKGYKPGVRHDTDQFASALVVKMKCASFAVRLPQHGESGGSIVCGNLDENSGSANAHCGDGCFHAHIAELGRVTGYKSDGSLHQTQKRRIGRSIWIICHLVKNNARIRRQA